jgi:nucleoside-triphosphatase
VRKIDFNREGCKHSFSINTLDRRDGVLAHQNIKSQFRVGKYGVNLKDIETIAVPSMIPSRGDEIVVIDEIGKMECFSSLFKETLIKVLNLPNWIIGSIAQKGDLFIQRIKDRDDVMLMNITPQNREILVADIAYIGFFPSLTYLAL